MQIHELAVTTQVPAKTIRFYESIGLLPPAQRASNGYRIYGPADVNRLRFIAGARSLGFSLDDVREALALRDRGEAPCRYKLDRIEHEVAQIDRRIADVQRLRSELSSLQKRALGLALGRCRRQGPRVPPGPKSASGGEPGWHNTVPGVAHADLGKLYFASVASSDPLHLRRKIMSGNCCSVHAEGCGGSPVEGSVALAALPGLCPRCGEKGKPVDGQTVKAMFAVTFMEVTHEPYLSCRTAQCPVDYYSADGLQIFTVEHVRERVYQKEPDAEDVPVCYCFRHTVGSVRAEIERTGRSTAVDQITVGTQADYCACDIRNPQVSCCLGNVRGIVKRLSARTFSTGQRS